MPDQYKPKKWAKRINLNNPSLNSFGIIAAFNPQIPKMYENNTIYYNALKQQTQSQVKPANKVRESPYYNPSSQDLNKNSIKRPYSLNETYNSKLNESSIQKTFSQNQIKSSRLINYKPLNPQINYNNSNSIRLKQLHGYNIINNI